MVATYSRCQKVLDQDAPAKVQAQFTPGDQHLLGDLGITTFADLERRGELVKEFLPQVWSVAEAIMVANPEVEG